LRILLGGWKINRINTRRIKRMVFESEVDKYLEHPSWYEDEFD